MSDFWNGFVCAILAIGPSIWAIGQFFGWKSDYADCARDLAAKYDESIERIKESLK